MQALGQAAQHGVGLVGGHALDDELAACHPNRELLAFGEQRRGPSQHARSDRGERRMTAGIHGVLVHRD